MTIKQLGGVFGRNPTFNDVTIEGQLTFDGDIDINSDLKINGELEVSRTGDGSIVTLKKGTTEVGSIKTIYNRIYIGHDDTFLMFANDIDAIYPALSAGVANNGNISLGTNTARYNDLFLAGDVVLASGQGIDFSATAGTGTSELLADYEEGIHTATLTPTTSGTIGLAGSANSLSYTKIGNMVNVTGYLYVSAISSPVGAINVSLPFAAADLTDGAGGSAAALSLTNIVSANVSDFVGRISETSSDLALYLGSSNNISAASAQQMQVGSQIQISVTYRTA
jgi:hypothetical protein